MSRISKGKRRYLTRLYGLQTFARSMYLPADSIDAHKVAVLMGTSKRLGGGFGEPKGTKTYQFKHPKRKSN